MNDDDVRRLDDAIIGLNKLTKSLNTFGDASLLLAEQHHALVTIVMRLAMHAEANGGVDRATICSEVIAQLAAQCGESTERDAFIRGILGQGAPPKLPPALSLIPGGKTD